MLILTHRYLTSLYNYILGVHILVKCIKYLQVKHITHGHVLRTFINYSTYHSMEVFLLHESVNKSRNVNEHSVLQHKFYKALS